MILIELLVVLLLYVMFAKGCLAPSDAFRQVSDEERLMCILFENYNPSARPVMNSTDTVMVQLAVSLMHIKDLDVRSQVLTTTGLLILDWQDERLTWDPREHNNLSEIIIEASKLWRPEFAVINGAEKIYEQTYNQFRVVINSTGGVHWEPGGVFKTMCEIDITNYPFDEQKCDMKFGAWTYHTAKMNLTSHTSVINLDSYTENGEWQIQGTSVNRNEFSYLDAPDINFAYVEFRLFLRRRHTFYIMNVILPSIMTSVLLLSIFFCTPGQKVQIGVVVLLSFRIFLLNVSGNIPKTSDHIPLLGIYLTATMAITTLSMVLTVFVLNLHHVSDRPVPPWAKQFVLLYLARMVGMFSITKQYKKQLMQEQRQRLYALSAAMHDGNEILESDVDDNTAVIEMRGHLRAANGTEKAMPMLTERQKLASEAVEKRNKESYAKDWQNLAEVFDRLFFWLFLIAIVVSTSILFQPLTSVYVSQMNSHA